MLLEEAAGLPAAFLYVLVTVVPVIRTMAATVGGGAASVSTAQRFVLTGGPIARPGGGHSSNSPPGGPLHPYPGHQLSPTLSLSFSQASRGGEREPPQPPAASIAPPLLLFT